MHDLLVLLILTGLVLAYASFLMYIRLYSEGVVRGRILRIIAEMWGTFILIGAFFGLVSRVTGDVMRGSVAGELAARVARIGELPVSLRVIALGAPVMALLLFAHLLWSLHAAQASVRQATPPADGG